MRHLETDISSSDDSVYMDETKAGLILGDSEVNGKSGIGLLNTDKRIKQM